MLEIVNQTPYVVALLPYSDNRGRDHAAVVIKSTWSIRAREQPLLADKQQPVLHADERHQGGPKASVRCASDVSWPKLATDVVLVGHAWAKRGNTRVDVDLRVGSIRKVVRVFGERRWYRSGRGWSVSSPRPFERMPLVYERAYGGGDTTAEDPREHAFARHNPVGTGFVIAAHGERLEGLALPNLEDPRHLISSWKDRPPVCGFGSIEASWASRAEFAGTYDARWKETRAPLLPEDFDARFFNTAHPDLIVPGYLVGGEQVVVQNVAPGGNLAFFLPRLRLSVAATIKGRVTKAEPKLDTLWIDADAQLLVTVFRTAIACPRGFLGLEAVFIKEVAS